MSEEFPLPTAEQQAQIDAMMAADAEAVANAGRGIRVLAKAFMRTEDNAVSVILTWMGERRLLAEAVELLRIGVDSADGHELLLHLWRGTEHGSDCIRCRLDRLLAARPRIGE